MFGRRPKLYRTTSFRLTILYAGTFSVLMAILFSIIYWRAAGFMAHQIDASINTEVLELTAGQQVSTLDKLRRRIAERAAQAPVGVFYLLEDRDGRVLAGNLPARPRALGVVETTHPLLFEAADEPHGYRGRGVATVEGGYLLVAYDSFQLEEMQEMLARAFIIAIFAIPFLSLVAGAVMSANLLRRVEDASRISREIVEGNLDRRIPVRGSDDEFDHLATSLNTMLDRIQSLMEGLRQVSNDIAHDLRTPLARLRQRLELARRRAVTVRELQDALDGSIDQVDGILETFGALLRIAQIEAGSRRGTFARLDFAELVDSLVEIYQPVAEEREQQLVAEIGSGMPIRGDRELLTQMLANLIENAIRHSPERAVIRLQLVQSGRHGELLVSDTGPGIPAPLRDKVFERFYRLEQSRTTPGSGLGLSLVAAVATLHDIAVELDDNRPGLKVVLRFDLAAA